MIKNTIGTSDRVLIPEGHQYIVNKGGAKCHCIGDTKIGGSLHQGDKSTTSPGHDVGFRPGIKDLFHIGCEISGVQRSEDVICKEFCSTQTTGITEGGS